MFRIATRATTTIRRRHRKSPSSADGIDIRLAKNGTEATVARGKCSRNLRMELVKLMRARNISRVVIAARYEEEADLWITFACGYRKGAVPTFVRCFES